MVEVPSRAVLLKKPVPMLRFLPLALAMLLSLTACSAHNDSEPNAPEYLAATRSTLVGTWITDSSYKSPDQPFLKFEVDGTWSGSDGCNSAHGTWAFEPNGHLMTTSGPQTQIYCEGTRLPLALSDTVSAGFRGTDLYLLSANNQELAKLHASTSTEKPALSGTDAVVGLWTNTEPGKGHEVFLNLSADGLVVGNDGCNSVTGTWKFGKDGAVAFGPLKTTQLSCDGVVTWLDGASSAVLDGTTMVVRSSFGPQLGTLIYQEAE